ncbi:NAD(P)/FAD-dependent oxidoreductase [Isachenkonia alkalipeptolytica]|uniref:FAD-binding protein n=1 Tax=Isachenkonia alkalipeptolytica TaxID=2565777 RepID=A0AA43XHG7_9CLOT|nr:FAD-binding protein [Isachenkonia alkalipeptolytica]NBG86995.1 FAD-binding protein [Isachenkonia alkalipeptolytica]
MIRISNIKINIEKKQDLEKEILRYLKISKEDLLSYTIEKKSIDARKNTISFIYRVSVAVKNEKKVLQGKNLKNLEWIKNPEKKRVVPKKSPKTFRKAPIVVGSGPAGLLAALTLAKSGARPILLERGRPVEERSREVYDFWEKGILKVNSNVQFGEGGAGTFSDGKLTTQIKDPRCQTVLKTLIDAGAPLEIAYLNKPHVGTDILEVVVKNLRERINALGGKVLFSHQVTDLIIEKERIRGVVVNEQEEILSDHVILALGHSARDTFLMLHEKGVDLEQKPFSLGLRIEHLQEKIDKVQYGKYYNHPRLKAGDYKLSYRGKNGRGLYTFCMCPGGEVIGASSEKNRLVTNGMSRYKRDERNANSALLVSVYPKDFESDHPLAGVAYQRKWEEKAFCLGGGNYHAPVQRVEDFLKGRKTKELGEVIPSYKPGYTFEDLEATLPSYVTETMKEGLPQLDRKLKGFGYGDAILTGVETRSSSPIRILRKENYESRIEGLYPAGEGAGYAGGIISAAVDGLKIAEDLILKLQES